MVAGAQRKINDKSRGPELGRLVRRAVNLPAFAFSAEQSEVIAHRKSPLVVCGGAGTGKTVTLIESVVARLKEGIYPDKNLILTYGRERASWVRDEIARRAGSTSSEPLARTFHSLALLT
jgi:superfamily I DNA/RNA helicase